MLQKLLACVPKHLINLYVIEASGFDKSLKDKLEKIGKIVDSSKYSNSTRVTVAVIGSIIKPNGRLFGARCAISLS